MSGSQVIPTLHDVEVTARRWFLGLCAGTVAALILAVFELILGRAPSSSLRLAAVLVGVARDFLRALPVIALVPVVQNFGVNERWKISLIAWAVVFPIWIAVRQALASDMIDTELAMAAAHVRRRKIFLTYHLPKALSGLFKGVDISIGVGWIATVAAEWVGDLTGEFWTGGIGVRIETAHSAGSWAGMFGCLALFGALGTASALLWRWTMRAPLVRFNMGMTIAS